MDVLIAPSECNKLLKIALPRPKDGERQHFLYDEENLALYELIQYSDQFRSWFIDNSFCQQGHFNMLTRIDPLFVFVPQLKKYAAQQFRPLDDICQEFSQNNQTKDGWAQLNCALTPYINWESVCDTKDLDGDLLVRFSETKTINWLVEKHDKLMEALGNQLSSSSSKATLISYALDLLDDYVPECLSKNFKDSVRSKQQVVATSGLSGTKKQTVTKAAPTKDRLTNAKRVSSDSQQGTPDRKQPSIMNFFKNSR